MVPVGAGGAADTLSRNLSNGFQQFANGQPLIVENRPGAGGTIAAAAVAREKPDGYTLFLAEVGPNAVSHVLQAKLPYDPHTAFTPIIHAANLPAVVLIRPTLPYKTLAEFIAAAKTAAGQVQLRLGRYRQLDASVHGLSQQPGRDRAGQRGLSLGRRDADVRCCATKPTPRSSRVSTALGQIKEGKVRALAGVPMQPMPQLPDTPPAAQTIPGFRSSASGTASSVPAGMDPALVARINGDLQSGAADARGAQRHHRVAGRRIVGGTAQQFDAFIKSELKRWPEVVKAAGIKPE